MIRIPHREKNPKIAELKRLTLFAGLSATRLRLLTENLDEVQVAKGERFITAGQGNDAFWILLEGTVELTVGSLREVLGPGDLVGLPSMFTRKESTADAVAVTPIRALVASHSQFSTLVSDREIEIRFKAAMFDRLRDEVFELSRGAGRVRLAQPREKVAAKAGAKVLPARQSSAKR